MARRKSLSDSLLNRPAPDSLLERNILQSPEAGQQLAIKRKRLEGFLAERPPPESVEQVLGGGDLQRRGTPPGRPPHGLAQCSRLTQSEELDLAKEPEKPEELPHSSC